MFKSAVVLLIALATAPHGEASVLVSNLDEPTAPGKTTLVDAALWAAQSFITDGNSYTLLSIETMLGEETGAPTIVAEFRKEATTGDLLTTFLVPSLAGPVSARTLLPAVAPTLEPNTTYWLILGVAGTGSFGWNYAATSNFMGPGELSAYGYSHDLGATWPPDEFNGFEPYRVRVNVNGQAIPEPSTLAICAAGLAILLGLRSRRRV